MGDEVYCCGQEDRELGRDWKSLITSNKDDMQSPKLAFLGPGGREHTEVRGGMERVGLCCASQVEGDTQGRKE